jgi:hypothetical protein
VFKSLNEMHSVVLIGSRRTSEERDTYLWPGWLTNVRERMEMVISQLAERYRIMRLRAHYL